MPVSPATVDWAAVDTCVFDMDGTLLDLHFDDQVWNHHLPTRYAERTGLDPANAQTYVSATLEARRGTLTWYCMEHWSRVFGLEMNALERDLDALIRIRPESENFLRELRRHGLRLILATNAHPSSLQHKLELTGIGSYFDQLVSAHDLGHAKEDHAFWETLAAQHDLDPGRTLFVDDNLRVLDAATRFGIRYVFGIAQPNSQRDPISHADYHAVTCFSEFYPALQTGRAHAAMS